MVNREQQELNLYVGMRPTNSNPGRPCNVRVYRTGQSYYDELFTVAEDQSKAPVLIEWGFGGEGPGDLAFSLLCDLLPIPEARRYWGAFFQEIVSDLPRDVDMDRDADFVDEWTLSGKQIWDWLDEVRQREQRSD